MNAAQERQLLDDAREAREAAIRVEQHLIALNAATEKNTKFRDAHPGTCEKVRTPLWTAINRNRLGIVIVALGGSGAAGVITKLAGLW